MKRLLYLVPLFALLLFWPNANSQTSHSVSLQWVASTTTGAQYNIYRSTTTGGPYTKLNGGPISGTVFNDTTGAAGTHYFYVVTALCGSTATCPSGVTGESSNSTEVSATFLGSPVAPAGVTATAN